MYLRVGGVPERCGVPECAACLRGVVYLRVGGVTERCGVPESGRCA